MPELTINLSPQAIDLLHQLERWGFYGFDVQDVAARFVDKALIDLVERGCVKLKPKDAALRANLERGVIDAAKTWNGKNSDLGASVELRTAVVDLQSFEESIRSE